MAPAAIVEYGTGVTAEEITDWWLDANLRTWYIAQDVLNSFINRTVLTVIGTLGSRLTLQQVAKLQQIASKYYDVNETVENVKQIKEFIDAINDVIEQIKEP